MPNGKLYMTASGVVCGWDPDVLTKYSEKCRRKGLPVPYLVKILAGPELEEDDDNPETVKGSDN